MEKLIVLVIAVTLLVSSEASPILTEKQAKQLLRSRRQDRPSKPGFPDEPIRVGLFPESLNWTSAQPLCQILKAIATPENTHSWI
ncbi:hypothetical protein A6R68_22361 [Neotoma lepida]|uniref:Uncharacterized protein n=1 Tax=Neotoma lepida TaxID=56216 RepID=A0A1A6HZI5_NEOLE|nr:hypothetical protein A6R68_22361 [Neotoma lepida]